jgi:hypothetical protein
VIILQCRRCVDGIWNLAPSEAIELGVALRTVPAGIKALADNAKVYAICEWREEHAPYFAMMPRAASLPASDEGLSLFQT